MIGSYYVHYRDSFRLEGVQNSDMADSLTFTLKPSRLRLVKINIRLRLRTGAQDVFPPLHSHPSVLFSIYVISTLMSCYRMWGRFYCDEDHSIKIVMKA